LIGSLAAEALRSKAFRSGSPAPALKHAIVVAAVVGTNLVVGVALGTGQTTLVTLAIVVPVLVVASSAMVTRREWLVYGAFLLTMLGSSLNERLPGTGGTAIFPADVFLALAVSGWLVERLTAARGTPHERLRTLVLSWPLALFAAALMAAVVRGHARYGTSYLSQPARMVLYAAIAVAIAKMEPRATYRKLVQIFYLTTVVEALIGAYHLASGTSQTASSSLSTGGTRALALTTAMFLAGGLILALLNLDIDRNPKHRPLHASIAALATFGIVISLGRTTFAALAVIIPILLIGLRRMRATMLAYAPLAAIFAALMILVVAEVKPSLGSTFAARLTGHVGTDTAVVQRQRKFHAALEGFGDDPILGLGFGRPVHFTAIDRSIITFSGDPEDSYIYVLAGGGIVALGSLIVLMLAFFGDTFWRVRGIAGEERALVVFSASLAFVFFVNALSGPILSDPELMLMLWILMLLPATVRRGRPAAETASEPAVQRLRVLDRPVVGDSV
jgi:O-antigen ligase